MSSNLPQRSNLPAARPEAREGRAGATFVYEMRGQRKIGGVGAAILGVLLFAALLVFLILGAITITIALWLACVLVIASILSALVRRAMGIGRAPPGDLEPR